MKLSELYKNHRSIYYDTHINIKIYEEIKDKDCVVVVYPDNLYSCIIKYKDSYIGAYLYNMEIRFVRHDWITDYFNNIGIKKKIDKKLWQEYQDYLLIEDL